MSTANETTKWFGWGVFAGVMIALNGAFMVLQGLTAIIGPNEYYVVSKSGLFIFDVNGWGWWNLILGVILVLIAVALLTGANWARIVAIIFASLSALGQLLLIPAQPWWSLIVIGVDVLIIYALTAHGDELRGRA